MSSLPSRPDAGQLRKQAKDLKHDVVAVDRAAIERVLAAHPVYVNHDRDRLDPARFTLRDAQVTLAREHGFGSWRELLAEVESVNATVAPRWAGGDMDHVTSDAFEEAARTATGDRAYVSGADVLLALLRPDRPSVARDVLTELGATYEGALARWHRPARFDGPLIDNPERKVTASSTPAGQVVAAFAKGFAVATGSRRVTPEHMLLALAFERDGDGTLSEVDVDVDDVLDALAARGVTIAVRPNVARRPSGPQGPVVYVLQADAGAVARALRAAHPPGTERWGTNTSCWKPHMQRFLSEDLVDLAAIARSAMADPSTVEVVDFAEAMRAEDAARASESAGS